MNYNPDEMFRNAAMMAALGWKLLKVYGMRDDGSCTCPKGANCPSKGKHPPESGWHHTATDDESQIAGWFEDFTADKRWNVGIRLGRTSGIVDIEVDDEQAALTLRQYGLDKIDTCAYQASRGCHYLFQWEEDLPDSAKVMVNKLECRIGGGDMAAFSVAPTSWHRTGAQYQWLPGRSPDDVKPAKLPEEFKKAVFANSRQGGSGAIAQARQALAEDKKVSEGGRHAFLIGQASWLCQRINEYTDANRAMLLTLLRAANAYVCEPPKSDDEVKKVLNDQFNHYRDRQIERQNQRPFERYGLVWNADTREWDPGEWRATVVHSDPVQYRLSIPNTVNRDEPRFSVTMDVNQWTSPRLVALAVLAVAKRIDLLDPNPGRWNAAWNGENIENEEGERRQVRGLRAKLMDTADDEYAAVELNQFAYTAGCLLTYLKRFDVQDGESEEDNLPNPSGMPKWIKVKHRSTGTVGDELWFKWRETWDAVRRKHDSISHADIKDLRARILAATGEKEFRDQKKQINGEDGRWLIWTDREMKALARLSGA